MTLYKIFAAYSHHNAKGQLKEYVISDYQIIVDNYETALEIYNNYINIYKKYVEILKKKSYNTNIEIQSKMFSLKAPLLKKDKFDSIDFEVQLIEPTIFQDGRISNYSKNNKTQAYWNYVYIEEPKIDGRTKKKKTSVSPSEGEAT